MSHRSLRWRAALTLVAAMAAVATLNAQTPWSQFRGNAAHTGAWTGYIDTDKMAQAWVFMPKFRGLGIAGFVRDSQPAVAADEGLVFAYGDYVDSGNAGAIVALDAVTGKTRWSASVVSFVAWNSVSSPIYDSGYVYWQGSDGDAFGMPSTAYVYKLNAMNGSTAYEYGGWVTKIEDAGIVNASPVIAGGKVYVTTYSWVNGTQLIALSAADGAVLWTNSAVGGVGGGSPAYDASRGLLYQTGSVTGGTGLIAISAEDGSIAWKSSWTIANNDYQVGLAYANDRVYLQDFAFSGADGKVYVADAANSGALLWSAATRGSADAVPAVDSKGRVFAAGDMNTAIWPKKEAGRVRAYDANGEVLWTADFAGGIYSSPAVAHGMVFIGAQNSDAFYLLDATTGEIVRMAKGSGPAAFGYQRFYTIGVDGDLFAWTTGDVYASQNMTVTLPAPKKLTQKPTIFTMDPDTSKQISIKTQYWDSDEVVANFSNGLDAMLGLWTNIYVDNASVGAFMALPPTLTGITAMSVKAEDTFIVDGYYWGTKKPKISLIATSGSKVGKSYACKLINYMSMPETGESRAYCSTPKNIPVAAYRLEMKFSNERIIGFPGFRIEN